VTILTDSLQFLKGIGPARATALAAAGLRTPWDVLHTFPRLVGLPPALSGSGPLPLGQAVRVRAQLVNARPRFAGGRGMALEATLRRADGLIFTARFFNAGYLRRLFIAGEWFVWEGRSDASKPGLLLHPTFQHLAGGATAVVDEETICRVAYRLPEGVSERTFTGLIAQLLTQALPLCTDPAGLCDAATWQAGLRAVHQPTDAQAHERARRLLAERELLALAWTLRGRRAAVVGAPGRALRWDDETHSRALARLPFALTPGQQTALSEIRSDVQQPAPMYRLLQGDVGSGKTALALLTILAAIAEQRQAALLAPTAVLAQQHAQFITRCLSGSRVQVGLLTGGTAPAERLRLLVAVAAGTCHLVIGTHAVLTDEVRFHDLAVVVIDEQHKFGVQQRATLINKAALRPHLLLMTATPIPRTLALTAFGDLAVSRIVGRPPGRAAVTTEVRVGLVEQALRALELLAAEDQAVVICALREAGEQAHDVGQVLAMVQDRFGADVEVLHGALSDERKLTVMARFRAQELRILVATTVVEVGIDVPTLALVIVLDAERFGLAQLHQLRGRLGRGTRPGHCLLLHGPDADCERLAILSATDDGLAIADADLATRGPGELLGSQQHGALRLRVADLGRDLDLLQAAHQRVAQAGSAELPPALQAWVPGTDAPLAGAG
jgi:ATP-dependent DNA helicase RecG